MAQWPRLADPIPVMPAASAVTLQEQEVLRKEPILIFFSVFFNRFWGGRFQMLLPNAPGPWSMVTGPFHKLEVPTRLSLVASKFWNGPKLNPSLRI
jgi:hypothetical protein